MICGEVCTEKLKKIVYVGSGPILYFCFTMAAYAVYKHYTNYKSPNHQEKIIGFFIILIIFFFLCYFILFLYRFVVSFMSLYFQYFFTINFLLSDLSLLFRYWNYELIGFFAASIYPL